MPQSALPLPYPASFPTDQEQQFLNLLLCPDEEFVSRWNAWRDTTIFDNIGNATTQLLPLLHLRLRQHPEATGEMLGRIGGLYKLAWFQNHLLLKSLKKLAGDFTAATIPTVFFKGIPLLLDVYQDIGARFLSDADILIHPKDITKTLTLLRRDGWYVDLPAEYYEGFSNNSLALMFRELTLVNHNKSTIDLHWRVVDDRDPEHGAWDTEIWQEARLTSHDNQSYQAMSSEDLLLHVIIHGAGANGHRPMRWIIDSLMIIRTQKINWDHLLHKIKTFGFVIEMRLACDYLVKYHQPNIPKDFLMALEKLPLSKKKVRAYYTRTQSVKKVSLFGNFPFIWRAYWQFEPKRAFPLNYYDFLDHLRRAVKLPRKRDLLFFTIRKYFEIGKYRFERVAKKIKGVRS